MEQILSLPIFGNRFRLRQLLGTDMSSPTFWNRYVTANFWEQICHRQLLGTDMLPPTFKNIYLRQFCE